MHNPDQKKKKNFLSARLIIHVPPFPNKKKSPWTKKNQNQKIKTKKKRGDP